MACEHDWASYVCRTPFAVIANQSKPMNAMSGDLRGTITFIVQKTFSITLGVLGALRITDNPPTETSLAVAKVVVGGAMLAVAVIAEVLMWRSMSDPSRRMNGHSSGNDDELSQRLQLLERALLDRLPPSIS